MTRHDAQPCATVREQLGEFMDRELTAADEADVTRHLADCAACRDALALERAVIDELRREVHSVRMPVALRDRLWAALRQAAQRELAAPGAEGPSSAPDTSNRPVL